MFLIIGGLFQSSFGFDYTFSFVCFVMSGSQMRHESLSLTLSLSHTINIESSGWMPSFGLAISVRVLLYLVGWLCAAFGGHCWLDLLVAKYIPNLCGLGVGRLSFSYAAHELMDTW